MKHSLIRPSSVRRLVSSSSAWRADRLIAVAVVAFLTVTAGTFLGAQAPAGADLPLWNGVFTQEQADRGSVAYAANCARCHGENLEGDQRFAPLSGDRWWGSFSGRTLDYMLDFITTNMPNGNGGSLSTSMYQDLTAFILSRNGVPAGSSDLTADAIAGITIIPESGEMQAIPSGTLASVIGCLVQGGDSGWMVQSATAPQRVDTPVAPEGAATMALGSGTVPLLFVMQSMTGMIGHRVAANGLLVGDNGVDGVNVTLVESLADTCP